MEYDKENVFCKIIQGKIKTDFILETKHALAFYDLYPQAKFHVLVIPKGLYMNFKDFQTKASEEEILDFWSAVNKISTKLSLDNGFKLITNNGADAKQEIHHFHVHVLANTKSLAF